MKNGVVKIIRALLGFIIACMMIAYIIKPIWLMECLSVLSIISFILFAIEVFVCHFSNACTLIYSFCRSKFLEFSGVVAEKLEQYSKQLMALQQKPEPLNLLAPRMVDKSEYVSILKSAIA